MRTLVVLLLLPSLALAQRATAPTRALAGDRAVASGRTAVNSCSRCELTSSAGCCISNNACVPLRLTPEGGCYPSAYSTVVDGCDVASDAGLLTGSNYFCLRPDGGSVAGDPALALTVYNSPEIQTVRLTPCGADGCDIQRIIIDGGAGNHIATSSVEAPAGDFVLCSTVSTFSVGSVLQNIIYKSANGNAAQGVDLYLDNSNVWALNISNLAGTSSNLYSSTTPVANARQTVCASYDYVTNGTSVVRLYVDGAQIGVKTDVGGPMMAGVGPWDIGRRPFAGPLPWNGPIETALMVERTVDSNTPALIAAWSTGVLGTLTSTQGTAVTTTAAAPRAACSSSDGGMSALPANRPCVTGGTLKVRSQIVNYAYSTENLTPDGGVTFIAAGVAAPTVEANNAVAPDGTLTAETVTFSALSSGAGNYTLGPRVGPGGLAAGTYIGSFWVRAGTATSTGLNLSCTGSLTVSTIALTSSWQRYSIANTTAGPNCTLELGARIDSGQTQAAGTVEVWGAQINLSPLNDYCPNLGAGTSTCTAETHTVPNPLFGVNPGSWCAGGTFLPAGGWLTPGGYILSSATAGGTNRFYLSYNSDSTVYFQVDDAAGANRQTNLAVGAIVDTTKAQEILGCSDNGVLQIWLNGVRAGTAPSGAGTGRITTQQATLRLTGAPTGGSQAYGNISNFRTNTVGIWTP